MRQHNVWCVWVLSVPDCSPLSRRGCVVPMRMMVKWEVNLRCQGGGLNQISTNYPDHGHHWRLPLSRKNAHGRAENRTRDLMVSSQELWSPSHEAGHTWTMYCSENTRSQNAVVSCDGKLILFSVVFYLVRDMNKFYFRRNNLNINKRHKDQILILGHERLCGVWCVPSATYVLRTVYTEVRIMFSGSERLLTRVLKFLCKLQRPR